jgi:hypothetical protein
MERAWEGILNCSERLSLRGVYMIPYPYPYLPTYLPTRIPSRIIVKIIDQCENTEYIQYVFSDLAVLVQVAPEMGCPMSCSSNLELCGNSWVVTGIGLGGPLLVYSVLCMERSLALNELLFPGNIAGLIMDYVGTE